MEHADETLIPAKPAGSINSLAALLNATVRHPAAWLFAGLYLLAVIYLLVTHHANLLLFTLTQWCFTIIGLLIVLPLTRNAPPPPWEEAPPTSRTRLWLQLVLCLLVTALALVAFFALYPSLSKLHLPSFAISVPFALIVEVIIPLAVVIALGANLRELGFGPGYRSWLVAGVLCLIILLAIAVILIGGWAAPGTVLLGTIPSFLTAGLPEETLFRGILMTRLCRLFGTPWGISLSALLFGLFHLGANMTGRDLGTALAICIISQAVGGLGAAIVFLRTRNILASVLVHGMGDTLSLPLVKLLQPFLR